MPHDSENFSTEETHGGCGAVCKPAPSFLVCGWVPAATGQRLFDLAGIGGNVPPRLWRRGWSRISARPLLNYSGTLRAGLRRVVRASLLAFIVTPHS